MPIAIETVDSGYRLVIDRAAIDAHRFEAGIAAATGRADPGRRLDLLDDALGLWRGAPLVEAT